MPPLPNSSRSAESREIFHSGKGKDVGEQGLQSLPAHVNAVKDGLLDFNHFLGLEATMLVLKSGEDDEDVIPLSAYKTDGLKASQRAREREFLEDAQGLAEGAQRLESGFSRHSEWQKLFRIVVTSRKDDVNYSGSYLSSTIACAGNEVWDTGLGPSRPSRAEPKPDLYFGFPVLNEEYQKIAGFRNDPSLQNYTVNTLSQLAMKGLRSIPVSSSLTKVAEMKRDRTELQFPLVCFPWCIIQLKGAEKAAAIEENNDRVLEPSCQASIAASGALAMLEKLARFADVKQDGQHIPPVITITSVGPYATVWLAFSEIINDHYRDHKMLSIWNGCISKIWDAIQFCRIIDNLFVWSQHILRPKVSHYIDQWRLHYCPKAHNLHFRLEKDLETAELVHRIQDRLSSLNISPNSNLPELVQQAVILQEAMRSNLRKTEPAPKEGLDPNAEDEIESSKKAPSHPKVDTSVMGASGDDLTEKGERQDGESKEEEDKKDDEKEDDDLNKDNGGNYKYYSTGSEEKPTLQSNSPENALVLADLPVSCEKPASGDLTATENKQHWRFANTKSLTATGFTFSAAPSKRPPTSKHVSISESPPYSSADEKRDSEPSFSYPYEFKTSDFEFEQGRFHSYLHKSKSAYLNFKERHPLVMTVSKEPTASEDSKSRKDSGSRSGSADTSSAPPNPFIAISFELSFDVKIWWNMMLVEKPSPPAMRDLGPRSTPPTQFISNTGVDEADGPRCSGRIVRSEPPKRKRPEWQPAEMPRLPSLKVKIPWKGNRFITVKLPPVIPAPPSKKSPDLVSPRWS